MALRLVIMGEKHGRACTLEAGRVCSERTPRMPLRHVLWWVCFVCLLCAGVAVPGEVLISGQAVPCQGSSLPAGRRDTPIRVHASAAPLVLQTVAVAACPCAHGPTTTSPADA
jgi:hypothetical protein